MGMRMTSTQRAAAVRARERYLDRICREERAQEHRMATRKPSTLRENAVPLLWLGGFAYLWLSNFMAWWG